MGSLMGKVRQQGFRMDALQCQLDIAVSDRRRLQVTADTADSNEEVKLWLAGAQQRNTKQLEDVLTQVRARLCQCQKERELTNEELRLAEQNAGTQEVLASPVTSPASAPPGAMSSSTCSIS